MSQPDPRAAVRPQQLPPESQPNGQPALAATIDEAATAIIQKAATTIQRATTATIDKALIPQARATRVSGNVPQVLSRSFAAFVAVATGVALLTAVIVVRLSHRSNAANGETAIVPASPRALTSSAARGELASGANRSLDTDARPAPAPVGTVDRVPTTSTSLESSAATSGATTASQIAYGKPADPGRVETTRTRTNISDQPISTTPLNDSSSVGTVRDSKSTAKPSESKSIATPVAAKAQTRAATVGFFGTLSIASNPAGAQVFIDGRPIGQTPSTASHLSAGSHVVRVDLDGFERWSAAVRVVAEQRTLVNASLQHRR